jgi:hypothetical protein
MYYPKSQIKPNLFTNGKEYMLSTTKEEYKGHYYKISTGQLYTGKNPAIKPNILLIPLEISKITQLTQNLPNNSNPIVIPLFPSIQTSILPDGTTLTVEFPVNQKLYNEYPKRNDFQNRLIPTFNPTLPTDQDKQNGQFNRYFCKKTNELKYLEIDKETYDQLQAKDPKIAWDLYEPASLLWVIKGNQETVFNTNKAAVFKIEQNQRWNGFSQYFKENYSKYYESSTISNLYTAGGEFTTKNGQNYIGFYHIHNGTIPMVGKNHINEFHETLIPVVKPKPLTQTTSSVVITTTPTPPTTSGGGGSYGGGGGGSY